MSQPTNPLDVSLQPWLSLLPDGQKHIYLHTPAPDVYELTVVVLEDAPKNPLPSGAPRDPHPITMRLDMAAQRFAVVDRRTGETLAEGPLAPLTTAEDTTP